MLERVLSWFFAWFRTFVERVGNGLFAAIKRWATMMAAVMELNKAMVSQQMRMGAFRFMNNEVAAVPGAKQIISLMVAVLVISYTLPQAISTLANTTIEGDPATVAMWGLLPLLVVIGIVYYFVPRGR